MAVNEFLQKDLLGQADIGNQPFLGEKAERNPNITVAELLDRAAKAIEGKFQGQAETEAAIRRTIGDAYRALGKYEQAQPHLERSVAVREQKLGADHPDTLTSKNNLAVLYQAQGEVRQGRAALPGGARAAREEAGGRPPRHPDQQEQPGGAVPRPGQVRQGRAALPGGARRQREKKLGADHPDTLTSKNNLAVLYHAQGKYDKAEPLFLEVLERPRRRSWGPTTPTP